VNYQVGAGSGQTMAATFNTLYKSVATSTAAANGQDAANADKEQFTVTIDAANAAAGDYLKITLTDNGSNSVDLLLTLDQTAVDALNAAGAVDDVVNGDIKYVDNGYTTLTTVLGQAGHAGVAIKLGTADGTTQAANRIFIQGSAVDQAFSIAAGGVSIVRGEVSSLDAFDISSATNAQKSVAELDSLITTVAAGRAKYGAYINRLEYASDNLMNVAQNTDASRSQIEDADYAAETSELARTQIIAQASTAMLAQANQSKQSVLALLQ
jgi:flagellin